jgi:hypothetical protein
LERVTSFAQWSGVWDRHKGAGTPPPVVDFQTRMVIAVFSGRQVNSVGLEAVDARERENEIDLYIRQKLMFSSGGEHGCEPVGFFALPLSTKKVVIYEATFVKKGFPRAWKKIAEIP